MGRGVQGRERLCWEWELTPLSQGQGERRKSFLNASAPRGLVALSLLLVGLEAPLCQEMFSQLGCALCARFRQNPSRMGLPCVESLCRAGLTYLFEILSDSQGLLASQANV